MTSWFAEPAAAPVPARKRTRAGTRPKARQGVSSRARARHRVRARAAIVWILVSAVLLAGVVFVNVAVLRLNLQIDQATQERSKLRAENAALESELSSALASPRIQSMARSRNGLVEADASTIGYIDLGR